VKAVWSLRQLWPKRTVFLYACQLESIAAAAPRGGAGVGLIRNRWVEICDIDLVRHFW